MENENEKKFRPGVLLISLLIHAVLMAIFATVQFSRGKLFGYFEDSPQARIRALERIEQAGIVVPKPLIKERGSGGDEGGAFLTKQGLGLLQAGFAGTGGGAGQGAGLGAGTGAGRGTGGGEGGEFLEGAARAGSGTGEAFAAITDGSDDIDYNPVSFFGNVASARKVVYVVDCSGSMLGFFSQVKTKLAESISSLRQDNFFGIIIFNGPNIIELKPGSLVRASDANKAMALEFLETIPTPQGRPSAFEALQNAIHYKDSIGDSPGVVYFLTDGFDYTDFPEKIEEYRKQTAPVVRIHTIGFMVNTDDADMLRNMARQSGGEFTLYSGGVN